MAWMLTEISAIRINRRIRVLKLILVGLIVWFLSCGDVPVLQEETFDPQVRQPSVTVKLLEMQETVTISSNARFVIRCFSREGGRSTYYASAGMQVQAADKGIRIIGKDRGPVEDGLYRVSFLPKEGDFWICLNGRPYRGVMEVKTGGTTPSLLVLNLVHVEDYLKGVVPAEMGRLTRHEMEALKAQAVAARTYSLSRLGQYADQGYDLEASVADQVYGGVEAEELWASRAVELTSKQVLTNKGKLVQAYYHANSGGKTEEANRVWERDGESYLMPVEDARFCSWSDKYSWEESWTAEDLRANIGRFLESTGQLPGGRMGRLLDLRINRRTPSGRVEMLQVVTDRGNYQIFGDKIRWALRSGKNSNFILPSTRFILEIQRDELGAIQQIFAWGWGDGHGVGMCQTGAIGMARDGYSYQEILTFYYPGAKITTWN